MTESFVEAGRDPRLIRGVHRYCDEWCDVCPVASRCLAHRCVGIYRKAKGRHDGDPTFRSPDEAAAFARQLAAVERTRGADVEVPLAGRAGPLRPATGEPLVRIAWEYALAVSMWLVLTPDDVRRLRLGGVPSPEEVVLWYHLRIYMKLLRAVMADECGTGRSAAEDAAGLAKVTLVSIERSRKALRHLKPVAGPATVGPLETMLEALERGIDDRFPGARGYVRVGLDAPVG